jgi:short-subunit dehydrogenase
MTGGSRWALVTGGCGGIGLHLARGLAARGYPVVLTSNRCERVEAVAASVASEFGVTTQAVTLDLARPEAAATLYEDIRRRGLEIEILVSNAGMFFFGELTETDPAQANAMLQLHVVTPSLLALHFGHDMRDRRSGHFLFVSSASSAGDFPGTALYGSSKKYLRGLAAALREELLPWGVNVTCVAPGAVATDLYNRDTGAARLAARLGVLRDPATVAEAALRGMFRRRGLVLPGAGAKLMAVGSAATPRWLVRAARMHTSYLPRPRPQEESNEQDE